MRSPTASARLTLSVIGQARKIDPDDVEARQIEAIALGRLQRFEEARESLQRLAEQRKDGETLGLLARTWKDEWTRFWNTHAQRKTDPLAAARDTAASLRAIENLVQAPVHPLRFRANFYVEGWPAWHEASLLDQTIAIGSARAKVVKRITRCAAVNVDPETGVRDLMVPQTLMQRLGHNECGIYAEIVSDGEAAIGDTIAAEQPVLV